MEVVCLLDKSRTFRLRQVIHIYNENTILFIKIFKSIVMSLLQTWIEY